MDVGALTVLLLAFENRDASIIRDARFEKEEGEPVLVIPGGAGANLRWHAGIGGNPVSDPDSSGFVRLRPALANLVRNNWFFAEATAATDETKIRLGERAKMKATTSA